MLFYLGSDVVTGRIVTPNVIQKTLIVNYSSRIIALLFRIGFGSAAILNTDQNVLVASAWRLEVGDNQLCVGLGAKAQVLEFAKFKLLSRCFGVAEQPKRTLGLQNEIGHQGSVLHGLCLADRGMLLDRDSVEVDEDEADGARVAHKPLERGLDFGIQLLGRVRLLLRHL